MCGCNSGPEPKKSLGIELGSTRIKAVVLNEDHTPDRSGDFSWKSTFENGIWTYDLADAWKGLKETISKLGDTGDIRVMGISAMMHGYLVFDSDWNLLVPFRTWQNTITGEAAAKLTDLFGFNIPQRWSAAHIFQAVLNGEEHVPRIAHLTTLAGYIHYMLTGVNAVGVGEASGMFPLDPEKLCFDEEKLRLFDMNTGDVPWKIADVLPDVLPAGAEAGRITAKGSALLDGMLREGLPLCPPEGDAGTGMVATNSVAERTGNISAGTSIFSMLVLDKPLRKVHPEIDIVATPAGRPVAMVHGNNCTNDMNAWVSLFREAVGLFGGEVSDNELFTKIYRLSLEGDPSCGGITICNYLAGETVAGTDSGRPLVVRRPDSDFTLANFMRAQLFSTMATLRLGMDILTEEGVTVDSLTGHGGLFKTPLVGQRYMAAVCGAPVTCMSSSGEGGPFGMALLAEYSVCRGDGETLEDYLADRVFSGADSVTVEPDPEDVRGFEEYMERFRALLEIERAAVKTM